MASATGSRLPMAQTDRASAAGAPARRRKVRYRRRLRSRIVLSYLLLGFGLTLALAVATNWARSRVENQLVEDVMNKNIDEYARRYYADPAKNPAVPVEQIKAFAFSDDKFDRVRAERPEWAALGDGIYTMNGVDEASGTPFAYKLAV